MVRTHLGAVQLRQLHRGTSYWRAVHAVPEARRPNTREDSQEMTHRRQGPDGSAASRSVHGGGAHCVRPASRRLVNTG
jgi:hypothetical protein